MAYQPNPASAITPAVASVDQNDASGTTQYPSAVAAWSAVAVFFLLTIIAFLDRNVVTLLIGPIKRHFDLTDVQISLLLGVAFAVPFGVLSIPIGLAVDRFQRRLVVAAGIAMWSIATAGTGLARTFEWLFIARACVGSGEATLIPAQSSILSDIFPRDKLGLALSLTNMALKAGQGVALIVGGAMTLYIPPEAIIDFPLIGAMKGWQAIILIIGLAGLPFIPLVFVIKEPARQVAGDGTADTAIGLRAYFKFVMQRRHFFFAHHLGILLYISLSYAVISWTPAFLMRFHNWPESIAGGWLGTAFFLGPVLGAPLHGAIADYLLRRGWTDIHMRYPMISVVLGMPLGIAVFLVPSPEVAVVLVGLFIFTIASCMSLPLAALLSVTPSRMRGRVVSFYILVCSTSGATLGPLAVGVLTDKVFHDPKMVGYSIMVCIIVLMPAIAATFAATLKPFRAALAA